MPEEILEKMAKAIVNLDVEAALSAADEAIAAKMDLYDAMEKGVSAGMKEVGDRFEKGEFALPELLLAADTSTALMERLKKNLQSTKSPEEKGTVVIGTVAGDIHDIGIQIVTGFLQAAGFNVVYLGRDVPVEKFIEAAEKSKAEVIGAAALLSSTMQEQKKLMGELNRRGLRDKYKVVVGGGAASETWCRAIGAHGYGRDAIEAVQIVQELIRKKARA